MVCSLATHLEDPKERIEAIIANSSTSKDMSHPLQTPSYKSKLWSMLSAETGHQGVRLDADSRERFLTWMDTYAHRLGHFTPQQEEELKQLRRQMRSILVETARTE